MARCARAQAYGGVLSMIKGTSLFDTVAISGTKAKARAGLVRRCAFGRVWADGVRGRLQQAWLHGWCAERRRRGFHG
jgi:hypothetical protein